MGSVIEKAIKYNAKTIAKRKGASDKEADDIAKKAVSSCLGINENYPEKGFLLIYDSYMEGLEPIYFQILDMMRDKYWGLGLDVSKTLDEFEASVGGGFYGDLGSKAGIIQDRAMKHIATINTIIKSVLNLIYSLKEFDNRLLMYDRLKSTNKSDKEAGLLALKSLWMDKVDMQKGNGSINMLTQKLGFVTLRDAFMKIKDVNEAKKADLNERVQRILMQRIAEFNDWLTLSDNELRRRYRIERLYLKSQIESLKLYSQWAKPYLIAAQKLQMVSFNSPDLVNLFDNLRMEVNLFGKKVTDSPIENTASSKKYYSCLEVIFSFRSIPHITRSQQGGSHYSQGGRIELRFMGFGLDEDQVNAVEEVQLKDSLSMIAGVTDETINEIIAAAETYTKDKEETFDFNERLTFLEDLEKTSKDPEVRKRIKEHISQMKKSPQKKIEYSNPFSGVFVGFSELFKPVKGFMTSFSKKSKLQTQQTYIDSETKKAARTAAGKMAFIAYDVFKKTRRMLAW